MKKTIKIIISFLVLFSAFLFIACGNSRTGETSSTSVTKQKETLDSRAEISLDSGTFDQKIEILKEYKEQGLFKADLATKISAQLRELGQVELKNGNIDKAYEMAKKIFAAMAVTENIANLGEISKSYSKVSFDKKDYLKTIETSSQVLQLTWDENSMGLKLAAEVELLNAAIAKNDLKQGKTYYSDIISITSLKGNEKLAEKYRASAEKYSDKFPKDTKPANEPTSTIVK